MKSLWIAACCLALFVTQTYAQNAAAAALKTQKEKVSYGIGLNIGNNIKQQKLDIDPELLAKGLKDAITGAKPLMTEAEMKDVLTAFQKEMDTKIQAESAKLAEKNKAEGAAFLKTNGVKAGVKTTASGLQYKVDKMGTGPKPKASDTVTANYRGTLLDGTEFDSSYKRGQPATFQLSGVIKGWTEGLQLMPVGSKFTLYIPADLGYGDRGAGQVIGPNATLIFDVELISIKQ